MRARRPRVCDRGRRKTRRDGHRSRGRCSVSARLIGSLFLHAPPSVDSPSARDVFSLMHTLGDFRSLPKDDQWRLLRWGPMAVADLVAESIDTELLRATVAADGIFGAMLGPWSAGSGLQLLLTMANRSLAWPAGRARRRRTGRARALARDRGSTRFGVTIRTGCQVDAHRGQGRSRHRRHARWRRIHRSARRDLRCRSEAHFPDVVRCRSPAAGILVAHEALPIARHAREGEPRAVGVAVIHRRDAGNAGGPRASRAGSRLSRARVRSREVRPLLDAAVDRIHDSVARRSVAGAARARTSSPRMCSSRRTRFATADWDASRDALGDTVDQDAVAIRAGYRVADRRAAGR